jgi:hypothetical protein
MPIQQRDEPGIRPSERPCAEGAITGTLCAALVRARQELTVYVPQPASPLRSLILAGSAIVGPGGGERQTVYYEGDAFKDGRDFHYKLLHAADRMLASYPTSALVSARAEDLIEVATYDFDWRRLEISDPVALADWVGAEPGELPGVLGTPEPPARVARDHPEYMVRLSQRITSRGVLSSSEINDAVLRVTELGPEAQRMIAPNALS